MKIINRSFQSMKHVFSFDDGGNNSFRTWGDLTPLRNGGKIFRRIEQIREDGDEYEKDP